MNDVQIQHKTYDQVTWAMAHDSHTATKIRYFKDDMPMEVDQYVPIADQLSRGVRAVRISAEDRQGSVILRHGDAIFGDRVWFWPLSTYLIHVRDFLNVNPLAVVTIIDEGDTSDGAVADVYVDVFGGTPKAPGGGKDGKGVRTFLPDGQWPTIAAMAAANTRLVVFRRNGNGNGRNAGAKASYPFLLKAWSASDPNDDYLFANPYEYLHPREIRFFPHEKTQTTNSAGKGTFSKDKLYLFNHTYYDRVTASEIITTLGFNDILQSSQARIPWVVGSWLLTNTVRAWVVTGCRPNFINVDFFDGANLRPGHHCSPEEEGFLLTLVNRMNQVDSPTDLRFVIRCQGKPELALCGGPSITVRTCDPANSSFQWGFARSHSSEAIAIVHPDHGALTVRNLKEGNRATYGSNFEGDEAGWSLDLTEDNTDGIYSIRLLKNDRTLCLDASAEDGQSSNLHDGASVQGWNWHGNGNQKWQFELAPA